MVSSVKADIKTVKNANPMCDRQQRFKKESLRELRPIKVICLAA